MPGKPKYVFRTKAVKSNSGWRALITSYEGAAQEVGRFPTRSQTLDVLREKKKELNEK